MQLSPATVKPLASFTASGRAKRKTASRFYFREVGATGLGTLALSFTTGGSGQFSRTLTAPDGPDRSVEVILRQRRSDGVWAQVDMKLLTIAGGGGGTVPVPNPPPSPPPDVTAPVPTGIAASATTTTAQVSWSQTEAGTGQVEYGTTTGYGQTTTLETGFLTAHSQTISGLTPGQAYHYRVLTRDAAGNLGTSSDRTFTTTSSATLPGAPTNLVATGGNAQVVLTWTAPANNGGSAITGYRIFRNGSSLTTDPASPYTDSTVTNGVQYSYTAAAITAVGEGPQSNTATATPAAAGDINPPVISNVVITVTGQTTATVAWTTNEAATGIVDYGLTPAYGSSTAPTSSGTAHSRNLTGLSAGQTYHIRIRATDTAGNTAQDTGRSFTTLDSSPATCTTTVAAGGNIQAAIDAAGSGATICLTAGATYILSSSLNINGKTGLTLDGKGATIRTNLALGQAWPIQEIIRCSGGSNLTFRNLTIIGSHNNPGVYQLGTPEFQAGIGLIGIQGCLVEYVTVRNNMGDGVGAYGLGSTPTRDVEVRYCDFGGQGRWGVTFTHAERGWVHHNVFANLPIAFETEADPASPAHFVNDAIFEDNQISGRLEHMFGGYGPGTLTDVIVRRNTIAAGQNRGIWSYMQPTAGFRAVRFKLMDNVGQQPFSEDPRSIIQLCASDNAVITGNTQPVAPGSSMVGVSQFNCTGTTVSGNSFPNTTAATATWGTCDG